MRCNAWSGGTGKSRTELLRRNPLYLRNPGSIFAHTCFTEINHVSTNGQGRHEESNHGKRIRNISHGFNASQCLCKTIYRQSSLFYLASGNLSPYNSDHIFYSKILTEITDAKSYFIVYVGIVVASVTAPAYEKAASIGTAAFWFGFVTLILLLLLITYRYVKFKEVPDPAKPLICIYAAPTSLCIAGYVQSVMPKSYGFLTGMLAAATAIYIFSLVKAITYLKMPFYPSYAAFTFPFVISAIASKQTMACAANMGKPLPFLKYVVLIETVIAVLLVVYTFVRYMGFLFGQKK